MNYKKIEQKIRNLILDNDIYYAKMIKTFEKISFDYLNLLQDYNDILSINEEFEHKISYIEILKQSLKFTKHYSLENYKLLKEIYRNKNINVDLEQTDSAYCDIEYNEGHINWPITFTIDDSFCLIHEFSHYLDVEKDVSVAREYLTETFAILSEFLLSDYLENENYDKKEYRKVKLLKFANVYDNAYELYNYTDMINIVLKYNKLNKDVVSDYYNNEQNLIKRFDLECDIYIDDELPFFENKKYLLGILLASDIYAQIKENPNYIKKIFNLQKNINNMKLSDCLKQLNVNIVFENGNFNINNNDYERIMTNFEKELKLAYMKYKEVENEENYCNCRTNRCRKN